MTDMRRNSLADAFDPKANLLTPMRLGLAAVVAVSHAFALGTGTQPHLGVETLGDLAVDAFFVVSGFLVVSSLLRLRSVTRYAWHRALRILPGFWVCLLVTAFVVAPLLAVLEGLPASAPFSTPGRSATDYVVANAGLLMRQFGIDGLLTGTPTPDVLDGALWTLAYEAACYAALAALGLAGLLRSTGRLAAVVGVLWLLTVVQVVGSVEVGSARMLRFGLLFGLGALAWLAAGRVPARGRTADVLAVGSVAVLVPSVLLLPDYRAVAAPAFAYLCLRLVVAGREPRWLRADLSYGLYVYHWPLQQVLVVAGLASAGVAVLAAASLAGGLLLAAASWWWVEKPALALKSVRPPLPAPLRRPSQALSAWLSVRPAVRAATGPGADGAAGGVSAARR